MVSLIKDALSCPTQHNTLQQCGDFGLSQTITTISQHHIVAQFISFPLDIHNLHGHKRTFMDIASIPGVISEIDGRLMFMVDLCQLMQLLIY